ncbi:MAG: hypothetical protein LC808_05180 [Actinobacteria bacterium]|nr:hypothetical protein [Actinomycetota bacterium]
MFVVAGLLLLSMGGAVIAAPATVPVMHIAASQHRTLAFRRLAVVLSALTVAGVAWALTYLALEEPQPWIWLLPSLAVVAVAAVSNALLRRVAATLARPA